MANFDIAHQNSDTAEGGYAKVAGDDGGETYRGISRRFFPAWQGWKLIDAIPVESKIHNARFSHVDHLVAPLYKANFWDPIYGDKINDQRLAEVMFDFAVTSGVRDAVILAQRTMGAETDGIMGSMTLMRINNSPGYIFLVDYCVGRLLHYAKEAKRDPDDRKFLQGWWKRVATFVRWQS